MSIQWQGQEKRRRVERIQWELVVLDRGAKRAGDRGDEQEVLAKMTRMAELRRTLERMQGAA